MKKKYLGGLLTIIIAIAAVAGMALPTDITDITPPQQTETSTYEDDSGASQESTASVSHAWTSWSESESPDMYRVNGTADITEQASAGDVQYMTDDEGHPYVIATLTADNLAYGDRERGDISGIYPPGWYENDKVAIKFADGTVYHGYFWNRSHLLAHMLGGEDSAENLITGTRCQNVGKNDMQGGMQYAETKAAEYIENGGEYIVYNVYPVYADGDILPRSVFIDMRSDDGTIDEQVEVYNVAPGFEIDYSTGEWHAI